MDMMYKLLAGLCSQAQLKKLKHLWRDVLQSIRGSEQSFTEGSIGRSILLLSIPMVLEMIMESIFALVDMIFVTRLGAEAVAIVGITEAMITLIYAIGMGMSMGTTALVARRIGEKKPDRAAVAAVQAIIAGLFFSLILAIPGWFMSKELLQLMGASSSAITEGYRYTMIIIGTNTVIMLLFIINAIFRSAGDAAIAMRILLIANGLNIILDPILIFGLGPIPALGITGAATATAIGRGTAVIIQVLLLTNKSKARIKVHWQHIVVRWKAMWSLLKISSGGMLQSIIATASWVGLVRILATFGDEVIAGYTIAIRIVVFIILPSFGFSNAAATLVGQNLGAQQPGRAEKSVWTTGILNMAFLGLVSIVFISFPDALIGWFTDEQLVITSGAKALTIISVGFVSYALGMVMVQSFNGAGDTKTPTLINFFCFWMVEIPLAYALALQLNWGINGVFWSIVFAESLLTIVAVYIFRQGKWKLKIV